MDLVERYRRNAEKCLRLCQDFKELDTKRSLLAMANAWLVLAAQRRKNIENEPNGPSPVSEPPPTEPPTPPPIDEPPKPPVKPPQLDLGQAIKPSEPLQC